MIVKYIYIYTCMYERIQALPVPELARDDQDEAHDRDDQRVA